MSTVSPDHRGRSDADLIASVRAGRIEEYGLLYERHIGAASRLARQLCRWSADADDLVSDSFARVLDALGNGQGPDIAFRAYLLSTMRRVADERARRRRPRKTSGIDPARPGAATGHTGTAGATDAAMAELDHDLIARAFSQLPERWQTVLWHVVIEQQPAPEVAPLLGLTPDGVSELAHRAGEGLRQEYLRAHRAQSPSRRCRATAARLSAWARDGLSRRERLQVEHHFDECARCRVLADEVADIKACLRGVVAFLVLGGAAPGYLAGASSAAGGAGIEDEPVGATIGSRVPRRFLGIAVSGLAITTAIAIALTTGGVGRLPVAEDSAPPARSAEPRDPAPPDSPSETEPPMVPSLPSLPMPWPDASAYRPPGPILPSPGPGLPPLDVPPDQDGPPVLTPPPQPTGDPRLALEQPADGVALQAGGPVSVLELTIRNDGATTAEKAELSLDLPDGVAAVPAQDEETGENGGDNDEGTGDGKGGDGPGTGDDGEGHADGEGHDTASGAVRPSRTGGGASVAGHSMPTSGSVRTGPAPAGARPTVSDPEDGAPDDPDLGDVDPPDDSGSDDSGSDDSDPDDSDPDGSDPDDSNPDDSDPDDSDPDDSNPDGSDRSVWCPAGTETVTCHAHDVPPGGSVVLRMRLRAAADTESGTITGTVGTDGSDGVAVRVPVTVAPPPDVARLTVEPLSPAHRILTVEVRNGGLRARPVTVHVDHYAHAVRLPGTLECESEQAEPGRTDSGDGSMRCHGTRPLEPDETRAFWALLLPQASEDREVTITATVGSDAESETVRLNPPDTGSTLPDPPGFSAPFEPGSAIPAIPPEWTDPSGSGSSLIPGPLLGSDDGDLLGPRSTSAREPQRPEATPSARPRRPVSRSFSSRRKTG